VYHLAGRLNAVTVNHACPSGSWLTTKASSPHSGWPGRGTVPETGSILPDLRPDYLARCPVAERTHAESTVDGHAGRGVFGGGAHRHPGGPVHPPAQHRIGGHLEDAAPQRRPVPQMVVPVGQRPVPGGSDFRVGHHAAHCRIAEECGRDGPVQRLPGRDCHPLDQRAGVPFQHDRYYALHASGEESGKVAPNDPPYPWMIQDYWPGLWLNGQPYVAGFVWPKPVEGPVGQRPCECWPAGLPASAYSRWAPATAVTPSERCFTRASRQYLRGAV